MLNSCIIDSAHGAPPPFTTRRDFSVFRCSDCGLIMADVEYRPQIYERESYYSMKFKSREDIDKYWGFRWRHVLSTARRTAPKLALNQTGFAPVHYETLSTYMEWLWNVETETHLYRRFSSGDCVHWTWARITSSLPRRCRPSR